MSHRLDNASLDTDQGRSPFAFFGLVFLLSIPFWVVGATTGLQLSPDLPVSSFIWVCPVLAASMLTFREQGASGVLALLRRSFDFDRIQARIWLLPAILLLPGIQVLTYGAMRLLSLPLPVAQLPVPAALVWTCGFLLAAEGEELGWSGYAIDPLQARWHALQAGLLVGLVWSAFHVVPLLQAHRSPDWIAWWTLGTVSLRVLLVWLYNTTGQSVFATALAHATGNLSQIGPFLAYAGGSYPIEALRLQSLFTAIVALTVIVVWGPRTLTRSPDR